MYLHQSFNNSTNAIIMNAVSKKINVHFWFHLKFVRIESKGHFGYINIVNSHITCLQKCAEQVALLVVPDKIRHELMEDKRVTHKHPLPPIFCDEKLPEKTPLKKNHISRYNPYIPRLRI